MAMRMGHEDDQFAYAASILERSQCSFAPARNDFLPLVCTLIRFIYEESNFFYGWTSWRCAFHVSPL